MCEFTRSEAIEVGDGIFAHEGEISIFHEIAFNLVAAKRVWTVKNHKLLIVLGAGFHAHSHCGIECVAAAANVLNVVDKHVNVFQHLGGGLVSLAKQREHLHASSWVNSIAHCIAGMGIAAHTMFGTEERHEFYTWCLIEDIDC